ncbi:MAG: hypothetical protein JST12_01820 [Armatimonadetes bacterium]|nr:hypothetical protein [Armatimonadota bacterium]
MKVHGPARYALVIGIAAFAAYMVTRTLDPVIRDSKQAITFEQFKAGKLPDLTGPYLSEAKAADLHFRLFDLGIGFASSVDDAGDVLYESFGQQPIIVEKNDADGFKRKTLQLPEATMHIRRRSGATEEVAGTGVILTPGGSVITHTPDNKCLLNGRQVLLDLDNHYNSGMPSALISYSQSTAMTDEGIYYNDPFPKTGKYFEPEMNFIDWSGKARAIGRYGRWINFVGSNSIATYSYKPDSATHSTQFLAFSKAKESEITLDGLVLDRPPLICTDSLYVSVSPNESLQRSPMKLVGGKFVRQAVPKGSYSAWLVAAGSIDRCVIDAQLHDVSRTATGFPFHTSEFYVEKERAYPIDDIYRRIGLENDDPVHPLKVAAMTPNGDLLVESDSKGLKRLYMLERLP